jgi:hypothetical protein
VLGSSLGSSALFRRCGCSASTHQRPRLKIHGLRFVRLRLSESSFHLPISATAKPILLRTSITGWDGR